MIVLSTALPAILLSVFTPSGSVGSLLIFAMMGLIVGKLLYSSSLTLIEARTADVPKRMEVRQQSGFWSYEIAAAAGFAFISLFLPQSVERYEVLFLFCICLCIGWIDWQIKKIPNELLLALILVKIAFLFLNGEPDILARLVGLVAGFAIFYLPALAGIPIGAGDIKYAAIAGFYFGVLGFLQVMLIMGLALTAYLVYLVASKKGNWKTSAPMGPFISLGILFTAVFPLF